MKLYTLYITLWYLLLSPLCFSQVVINEFMTSNSTVPDTFGEYYDWIELYNSGTSEVNLAGYYLSDKASDINQWQFPAGVSIQPESFLVVYAAGLDESAGLYTNFKLSAEGETIILSSPEGTVVDSIFTGEIEKEFSRGRFPDGGSQWIIVESPTPGAPNENGSSGFEVPPVFSKPAGYYSAPVYISLSKSNPSASIYYTLDGSDPITNSALYSDSILISATTVVRAAVFGSGTQPSKIITQTYLINETITMAVVSLTTDPVNLWDPEEGIYVLGNNYEQDPPHWGANFHQDWEKPVHIEFFEPSKELGFSIDAGVKIHGGWSADNEQKSLAIFARSKYGYGEVDYKLFPWLDIDQYEGFILRNGGNDWPYTIFRDGFLSEIGAEAGVDVMAYRPTVVFLNGEYWGIHNLREKVNEHFIASHHNVDSDSVTILENQYNVVNGDSLEYAALVEYLENNSLTSNDKYEYVTNLIDVEEFINYMIVQIYVNNRDWPGNNIKFWNAPGHKWRWIMFGAEFGFGLYGVDRYTNNWLDAATSPVETGYYNPHWATLLIRKLLENNDFKNKFINRFCDFSNSIFKPEYLQAKIDSFAADYLPEIQRHKTRYAQSYNQWLSEVDNLKEFAENRPEYATSHFKTKFRLGSQNNIELNSDASKGSVQINSLTVRSFPWSGNYFGEVPVTITAVPAPGYAFSHWEGYTSTENSITVMPANVSSLTAHFEQLSASGIVINEINYNSAEEFDSEDWVELVNNSEEAIDISGWMFKDEDDMHIFEIPSGTILGANEYIVLVNDSDMFKAVYPDVDNFIGNIGFGFAGGGELLRLYDNNYTPVDSVLYDDSAPWPTEPDAGGHTLSLINPSLDNTNPVNWKASIAVGTPGAINDVYTVDVDMPSAVPTEFRLAQNYPNPFNPTTVISYSLPQSGLVSLKVYDVLGREVQTLINEFQPASYYSINFNAEGLSSGVYFYRLTLDNNYTESKKMLLVR